MIEKNSIRAKQLGTLKKWWNIDGGGGGDDDDSGGGGEVLTFNYIYMAVKGSPTLTVGEF